MSQGVERAQLPDNVKVKKKKVHSLRPRVGGDSKKEYFKFKKETTERLPSIIVKIKEKYKAMDSGRNINKQKTGGK